MTKTTTPALLRRLSGLRISIGAVIFFVAAAGAIAYFVPRLGREPSLASEPSLEVKHLIRKVKEELYAAEAEMRERKELPLFELKEFEMESRAITSPAGTADTMECLAEVALPLERVQQIVRAHRACLVWGGRAQLSPADDVLISVSRPLSLDAPAQMVASILSKKIAAGSTHLVLDIPLGPTAKVRRAVDAQRLQQLFAYVAQRLGLTLDVLLTDGRQPVGRGIGPLLEARDVMQVLYADPAAPADLREKALRLAARVLELAPEVARGSGLQLARTQLESGRAARAMQALIEAQGRRAFDWRAPQLAPLTHAVLAEGTGRVVAIDNERVARIARLAGAPRCPGAGVDLLRKLGDAVAPNDALYRIHAESAAELEFARRLAAEASGYTIGDAVPPADLAAEF